MRLAILFNAVVFAAFCTGRAEAVPINGAAALPISEDVWLVRQQVRYNDLGKDRQNAGRKMLALEIPALLAYGLTAEDGIFFVAPYVRKAMKAADGNWRSAEGLGDGELWWKHIFAHEDAPGRTRRWAWSIGGSIPFGRDDATDAAGKPPQTLQPASGAVDKFGGLVYSDQSLDREFDVDVSYRLRSSANNFEYGDVLKFNLSYQKRFRPKAIPSSGMYTQVNWVIEVNGETAEWNHSDGVGDLNSGGRKVFLCPGIQFAGARMIAEASIQIPFLTNLTGRQIEASAVYVLSVRSIW
ncbi:hypothetical protein HY522_11565 [bacterium]|nr:hypothetical protein [bacterium]